MRHHASRSVAFHQRQEDWFRPLIGLEPSNGDQFPELARTLPTKALAKLLESDSAGTRLMGVRTAYAMGPAAKSILGGIRKLETDDDPEVRVWARRTMCQAREAGWTRD
jgi:hypothetical protein